MREMQIVLPGALPDAAIAPALVAHLEEKAPCFTGWLEHARANITPAPVADTFCTPFEYWLLQHHGFQSQAGQPPAAGLTPLLARDAGIDADAAQPLWLSQLVHVAPARDGAAMIPANELEITPAESVALFDAAADYFSDTPFSATPFDSVHWRIKLPADYTPACPSPALVSITSVNDWWTQDAEGRPWRRLVNELQMLWFDHPVNQAREARGLRPVNSLWLYGGARPSQLTAAKTSTESLRILRELQGPALVQDWGSWLEALAQLDRNIFATLPSMPRLVLTGSNHIVELTPARRGIIARLLGGKQNWRQWWSRHN